MKSTGMLSSFQMLLFGRATRETLERSPWMREEEAIADHAFLSALVANAGSDEVPQRRLQVQCLCVFGIPRFAQGTAA